LLRAASSWRWCKPGPPGFGASAARHLLMGHRLLGASAPRARVGHGPWPRAAGCRVPRAGRATLGRPLSPPHARCAGPASCAWWCGRRCSSRSGRPRLAPPSQVRSGWGRAGWAGALRVRAPQPPPVRESSCARVPGRRSWPCVVQGPSPVGACILIACMTVEGSSLCNLARPVRA